jgi:hypothetical protein
MGQIIPVQELTVSEIRAIREAAKAEAFRILKAKNVVQSEDEVVFRAPVLGDSSSTNFRDLDVATAAVSGQQEWLIDSSAVTAGDLINVLATGETVNDDTAIVFYGFANLGGDRDCNAIRFQKGAKILTYWNLEHLYAYNDKVLGYSLDFASYGPNETIKIEMQLRAGASAVAGEDYRWVPIAILAEPKSKSLAEG